MKLFNIISIGITAIALHSLLPTLYNKKLNPSVMREMKQKNSVMLTFDDGPDPRYTGKLLDLLKKNKVHAMFFVVIENAMKNEELIDRMLQEGHRVGFHSLHHKNPMLLSYFSTKQEFSKGCEYLKRKGVSDIYYRPPWGHTNLFTGYFVRKYNMNMILWSVMAEDWSKHATTASILEKCRIRIKNHSIICLHDAGEHSGGEPGAPEKTIRALQVLIPEMQQLGYQFVLPRKEGNNETNRKFKVKTHGTKHSGNGFVNFRHILSIAKG